MSPNMRKYLSIFLILVMLCSFFMIFLRNRKSSENLPELSQIFQMSQSAANAKLSGFQEHQLLDVWGKPDHSDRSTMVWTLPEGNLMTLSNDQGRITGCSIRHLEDLPPFLEISSLSREQLSQSLTGLFGEQLKNAWGIPGSEDEKQICWSFPEGSAHREVTVSLQQWGMVTEADFRD